MNERIKEIAEQAGFYFYDMHDVDGEDLGETIEADSWTAAEKFAELIVRQCGYYADVFDAMECPVDMDPTETKPSDYIKREMGITE